MYWCTCVSVFFLGLIQGFIFKDNQCARFIPFLIGDSTKLYSKRFPWLDAIDGNGGGDEGDDDSDRDENQENEYEVIQWDDKTNMQSLVGSKYKSSDLPENDLVELTGQQVNLIAKTWYTHVLSELFDDTKQVDNLEKMGRLKKRSSASCLFHNMNKFEKTYHKNEKYSYYVWLPDKINSKYQSDILACFAVKETDETSSLFSLLIHPMWTSKNISLKKLKESISALKKGNNTVDMNDFYEDEKNERIILEWMF